MIIKLLEILKKTTDIKKFIINYIITHQKKWKHKPNIYYSREIKDTIILEFGNPKTAIFTSLNEKENVFSVLYLAQQITDGILVFTAKIEIDKANHGILPKIIHEKYKISAMFFLNFIKITKHIKYKGGPVIGIIETETPKTIFLEKLERYIKKLKIKVQYNIHISQKKVPLLYNPYFFNICYLSLPTRNGRIYNKNLISLFKLIRYLAFHV